MPTMKYLEHEKGSSDRNTNFFVLKLHSKELFKCRAVNLVFHRILPCGKAKP